MVRFRHKYSDKDPLDKGPDNEDVEGPAPVCVIVDKASNDWPEFWSHAINLSGKDDTTCD